jgi:hypothetical protein
MNLKTKMFFPKETRQSCTHKRQKGCPPFFARQGYQETEITSSSRDYPRLKNKPSIQQDEV